jgi:signal transduction histidine kinase
MHPSENSAPVNIARSENERIATEIAAVAQIEAVPTLLEVLCDMTGMGFAAVARVTDDRWTLCAVNDLIGFGLPIGGELDIDSTLCIEAKRNQMPIFIEHASVDPTYCNHHTPKLYKIESYVSVPIVLPGGHYFGNLCAIHPTPQQVGAPAIRTMFHKFAALIAHQLENELSRQAQVIALRDAHAVSELREQFIAILGHDLRNPLHAVDASAAVLERRLREPELISITARIRTNIKRMSALIDDVLDFARARLGGGIGVQIACVEDLNAALMAVIRELVDAHPDRQILSDLSIRAPVNCDAGRIQQVASNLLGNALAHGAPSSPIRCTGRTDVSELILEVWNAGDPIPEESLSMIFQPFWRRSTAGARQGLGLGLHICSQIVRAHGGSLSVTSSREAGTTFTARLPLQQTITGIG